LACLSVYGDFELNRFAINAKDCCGFRSVSAGLFEVGSRLLEVFSEDGQLTEVEKRVLHSPELSKLTICHELRDGEAIHIYRNVIVLYLRKEDISNELVLVLGALAEILPTAASCSAAG
jgi:hypothetical protein